MAFFEIISFSFSRLQPCFLSLQAFYKCLLQPRSLEILSHNRCLCFLLLFIVIFILKPLF